jgi:hypothetical protein
MSAHKPLMPNPDHGFVMPKMSQSVFYFPVFRYLQFRLRRIIDDSILPKIALLSRNCVELWANTEKGIGKFNA